MITRFLIAMLVPMIVTGCTRFSEDHFMSSSFGFDVRQYMAVHPSFYKDGILQLDDVSQDDELFQEIKRRYAFSILTSGPIGYGDTTFTATEELPLWYIKLSDFDGYTKYIVYIPTEKKMIFLYADTFGA